MSKNRSTANEIEIANTSLSPKPPNPPNPPNPPMNPLNPVNFDNKLKRDRLHHHHDNNNSNNSPWQRCPTTLNCICSLSINKSDDIRKKHLFESSWISLMTNKKTGTVGSIFCINLNDRDDRMRDAAEQFHRYGLCRLVVFYRAQRMTKEMALQNNVKHASVWGCWDSHREVCRAVIKNPTKNKTLIFEDDVKFIPRFTTVDMIQRCADTELPLNWDVFFLGHLPCSSRLMSTSFLSSETCHINLFKTHSLLTHAYLLSEKGCRQIAESDFVYTSKIMGYEIGIDNFICDYLQQYAVYPQFARQSGSPSDNLNTWLQIIFCPFGQKLLGSHTFVFETVVHSLILIKLMVVMLTISYLIERFLISSNKKQNKISSSFTKKIAIVFLIAILVLWLVAAVAFY